MSDVLKLRTLAEVEEEAATWVWRLDDDNVPAPTRAEFEQWLRRDPRHRRAFDELGGVWHALDDLAEAKRDEKIATFVAEERRLYEGQQPKRRWLRRAAPWAVAASLAITVGAMSWFQRGNEAQTLATAVGQQRSATLADGSTVQLNTNTIVETRFDRARRVVFLRKGEAAFKVAHNPDRPFLVYAGNLVVRAVGTEFNVRLRDSRDVEVIVTEGRVAVEPPERVAKQVAMTEDAPKPALPATRELVAGQRFETMAPEPVIQIDQAALSDALAWREGAIVFDGEPLGQAIVELNRYTDARLVVADAELNELRVGGRFRAGDVDGFIEALGKAFPVTARRGGDGLIYLEAAKQSGSYQ